MENIYKELAEEFVREQLSCGLLELIDGVADPTDETFETDDLNLIGSNQTLDVETFKEEVREICTRLLNHV